MPEVIKIIEGNMTNTHQAYQRLARISKARYWKVASGQY
jgi:hypothetical protein